MNKLRRYNEKTDRNKEIISLYEQGKSLPEIADKYNISYQRIRIILKEYETKKQFLQLDGFDLILKHSGDYVSARRVYNALVQSGYVQEDTLREDLKNINLDKMACAKGCGKRAVEIVREIQKCL